MCVLILSLVFSDLSSVYMSACFFNCFLDKWMCVHVYAYSINIIEYYSDGCWFFFCNTVDRCMWISFLDILFYHLMLLVIIKMGKKAVGPSGFPYHNWLRDTTVCTHSAHYKHY